MTVYEEFGEKLDEKKWSNVVAAKKLDCHASYISNMRLGRMTPSLALAARIERTLGIPCIRWADEKPADRKRNRPKAVGRQGRPRKAQTS